MTSASVFTGATVTGLLNCLPAGVTAPQNYVYHCHIVEHEEFGFSLDLRTP